MSSNASKDLIDLIDNRISINKTQRVAIVESVSEDNKTVTVKFPGSSETYDFYNKSAEVLKIGESCTVTSNDGDLMNGYVSTRFGESSWLVAGKEIDISKGAIKEEHLSEGSVTEGKIADFSVTNAKIGFGEIDTANIRKAAIETAQIQDAAITNAKIKNLAVDNAKIAIAAIDTANIKDLAVKRACIDLEAVGTSQVADGSITDGKIVSLTAGKIVSGTIDTSKVTVLGTNGKLRIANNRLQVFDNQTTPIERVSLGDVNGDGTVYGFRVRGADGTTTLMDETGVKKEGITDGSITNSKISNTADIDGTKLLDNSIAGGKLVVDAVTAREIAAKTITANEIVSNTITAGEIATGAITADEIAAEAVTAAKIKAGEITTDHISSNFGETLNISANSSVTDLSGRLSSAELKIAPDAIISTVTSSKDYTDDLSAKANTTDLGNLTTRVSSAESKITPTAIISTVTGSSTYTNAMTGKANKSTIVSEIIQSAEGIKISAEYLDLSGVCTFSNDTVSSLVANARTNAVSDVTTKLSTAGQTVINGSNITTGTINCNRISGGTLNFSTISATGKIYISDASSAGLTMTSGSHSGGIYSNSSRGLNISTSDSMRINSQQNGNIEISNLYAYNQPINIPMTSSGTQKINAINYQTGTAGYNSIGTYMEVATANYGNFGLNWWASDISLKKNIIDYSGTSALEKINKIKHREFDWKENDIHVSIGYVSQELMTIDNSFAFEVKQEGEQSTYQPNETVIIPTITKAIQELSTENNELKTKVNDLQNQINELRDIITTHLAI